MKKEDCYKAGFIMKPHGLKGEVTVSLNPDSPAEWSTLKSVLVENQNTLVPYFIESVSVKNDKAFVKFEDVSTPEEAAKLKNHSIYLLKTTRPKLKVDDFYDDEIIGFQVSDQTLGLLGTVKTLERAGINRFIILDYEQKEVMIPAHQPLVKSINRSKKIISVNLPDGFLDI
ncbi:MAG: 16S rRNA processing protein RimM [Cyclobacteriaceae bacterium]|nr:16S rRNA processing protein RimM [Cyclobacteriaceae bacterium]MBX2957696.1 16S rRNA processing protein RimM [Cyclobacteriaceae bacterium]